MMYVVILLFFAIDISTAQSCVGKKLLFALTICLFSLSGVDLTLSSISITDNGRISSVDAGQTLACTSTQGGTDIGSWILPNGITVREGDNGVVESDGSIALTGPLGPGVYRCNIVDGNGDNCIRTLYVLPNTGMYFILANALM